MTKPGPWSQPPAPRRPKTPPRRIFPMGQWLALAAAIGLGVYALSRLFPGRMEGGDAWAGVGLTAVTAAYMGARLLSGHLNARRTPRHLAVWVVFAALLLLGYSFKDDLSDLAARLGAQIVPGHPAVTAAGQVVIVRDQAGGFFVTGQVNGQPVRFLVDTGASDIVLSPDDARRLGVDLGSLHFTRRAETANGEGAWAPFTADSLTVGSATLSNVPVSVNQAPMTSSLLGMAFLGRMKSFHVEGDRLVIQPPG